MTVNDRETILQRLKAAASHPVPPRPLLPPLPEMALDADRLREVFVQRLTEQGGEVHPVANRAALLETLGRILADEQVVRAMAAADKVVAPLDLVSWGRQVGVEIVTPEAYPDRDGYARAVFDDVQAGITGADFAVAESGTLVLVHDTRQARLISLAPVLHIAVVPVDRIVPAYETAVTAIYADGRRPSQVTFITGPSMTADIQATPFKGMHGPQKVIVLLVG
ncbi:MAG: lactate utilization protein [Desulfatitalea sp.]|nr:lactate utilization protein [Desulfatitalea sp.]